MLTARQPTAASHSERVATHQTSTTLDGECVKTGYLRGPMGEYRIFEVPCCEYAMRGSPGPHPTLPVFKSIKGSHAVMVDISTMRISEAPWVNMAYSRSQYGEIITARQPTAASHSTWVATH